jgi:hypothetical protein
VYDPIELGVSPGTLRLEAGRMLNLDPDVMELRQRREPDGSILRPPRGWWKTDGADSDTPPEEIPICAGDGAGL